MAATSALPWITAPMASSSLRPVSPWLPMSLSNRVGSSPASAIRRAEGSASHTGRRPWGHHRVGLGVAESPLDGRCLENAAPPQTPIADC